MRQQKNTREKQQAAFLEAVAGGNSVCGAVKAAGASRASVYRWKDEDAAFGEAWNEAREECVDLLEAEAKRRALEGSDTLLIFLLKSYRPDVFSERVRQTIEQKAEVRTVADDETRTSAEKAAFNSIWTTLETLLADEPDLFEQVVNKLLVAGQAALEKAA